MGEPVVFAQDECDVFRYVKKREDYMKLRVIPSVDELVEVLRPYLWAELSDDALRDVLATVVGCGFEISHEVEADDAFVTQLERSLVDLREGRGVRMGRPRRRVSGDRSDDAQAANARSQHVRFEPRRRADLGVDQRSELGLL